MSLRNSISQSSRTFSRGFRRQYSTPPPTYPANNNPIHISPENLGRQRTALSSFLRWCVAGALVGLPSYWIIWLGQKVSIPYCNDLGEWRSEVTLDIGRLDSFQTKLTDEQKAKLARTNTTFDGKFDDRDIGWISDGEVDNRNKRFNRSTLTNRSYAWSIDHQNPVCSPQITLSQHRCRKIDPTRIIYRLDISREGIFRSQKTFNPADISSLYVSKDILPESTSEGEVGYKSLDDVREGYVVMEGMVKITGPRELGGRMGTVEFSGIIKVETAEIVKMKKAVLRVMGKKVIDWPCSPFLLIILDVMAIGQWLSVFIRR